MLPAGGRRAEIHGDRWPGVSARALYGSIWALAVRCAKDDLEHLLPMKRVRRSACVAAAEVREMP